MTTEKLKQWRSDALISCLWSPDRGLAWLLVMLALLAPGCAAIPEISHEPQFHNPFPQLSRVAVLPFFNQSGDPTLNQDALAAAYFNELQAIPGFEVMPVGVARRMLQAHQFAPQSDEDFQKAARLLGVDAVVVGSVTEYSPYYPPRMGIAVNWYAANPGFHPIPPGYGLPWGTSQEEHIPEKLVFEAEFALAREQLQTQTPLPLSELSAAPEPPNGLRPVASEERVDASEDASEGADSVAEAATGEPGEPLEIPPAALLGAEPGGDLPPDWPDPRGFVPPPPGPQRPPYLPQGKPVMSHVRLYHGNDTEFTEQLANYFYFRDDARLGGWQAYLQRSDDFIRFCCYLHITEMLTARGGAGKTRVVWRWPIYRYER